NYSSRFISIPNQRALVSHLGGSPSFSARAATLRLASTHHANLSLGHARAEVGIPEQQSTQQRQFWDRHLRHSSQLDPRTLPDSAEPAVGGYEEVSGGLCAAVAE